MMELDRKLIDAVLFIVAAISLVMMVYRVASCNEYQSRLTGKPAFGQSLPPSFCADPPCVERTVPEAQP